MVSEGQEGERDFCAVYRREFGIIEKKMWRIKAYVYVCGCIYGKAGRDGLRRVGEN